MVNMDDKSPLAYSIGRIVDTIIGIAVAFIINYFIFPPINLKHLSKDCQNLVELFFNELKRKICQGDEIEISKLNEGIHNLEAEYMDYKKEFKGSKHNSIESSNTKETLEILGNILDHLKIINSINSSLPLNQENCIRAKSLFDFSIEIQEESREEISVVYNYHVSNILDYIEDINRLYNIKYDILE